MAEGTPPHHPLSKHRPGSGSQGKKHGAAVFGQARITVRHVTWNTCCRHKPTLVHDDKRMPNTPAHTAEPKSTWDYSYTNTLTPILTLPAARTKLQNFLYWIGTAQTMVQKKKKPPNCGNMGSLCLSKPEFGQGEGGNLMVCACLCNSCVRSVCGSGPPAQTTVQL